MRFYRFTANDQRRSNWLIHRWIRRPDGVPDYVPGVLYKDLVCPACARVNYDKVFQVGFEKAHKIRGKGDILATDDNFLCVKESVVNLLKKKAIGGAQFKRIADTEWHVVNIVARVPTVVGVYQTQSPPCSTCGGARHLGGYVDQIIQFREPPPRRSLFSSVESRERDDRDLMFDDYVLNVLVEAGITGGEVGEIRPEGCNVGHYLDLANPKNLKTTNESPDDYE
jgi:hypothetical protein